MNIWPGFAPRRTSSGCALATPAERDLPRTGNSFVCGPQGEYLARADRDQEQTLVVDLDMARSEEVRRIWPYLRDRRVDAYQDLTKRYRD